MGGGGRTGLVGRGWRGKVDDSGALTAREMVDSLPCQPCHKDSGQCYFEAIRHVVVEPMETGAVIIHTATGECFELNHTALEVWDEIRRRHGVVDIVGGLMKRYDLGVEGAAVDVQAAVEQLLALGLVKQSSP